jgi:hypothetical protein
VGVYVKRPKTRAGGIRYKSLPPGMARRLLESRPPEKPLRPAPKPKTIKRRTVMSRFMDMAMPEPNSGCWIWTGAVDASGYGQMTVDGQGFRAHRISWMLFKGWIPGDLFVCHKCDVRCCVNPEHLWLGDPVTNGLDRDAKGRGKYVASAPMREFYASQRDRLLAKSLNRLYK